MKKRLQSLTQSLKQNRAQARQVEENTGRQLKNQRRGFQPVMALAALVIAFGFWVYVRSVVTPYATVTVRRISIQFAGEEELQEDRSLMMDVVSNPMADITLYGKRSELTALTQDKENITLTVDLSSIRQAGSYELPYKITYADGLDTSSISVVEQDPSYISLSVANLTTVTIPVKGLLTGDQPVAEGYLAGALEYEPAEITIKGPEAVVSQIEYAQVELQRENLTATVTETLPYALISFEGQLVESDELTANVEEIQVTQPVAMTKTVPLSVELISGGGATRDNAVTTIEPQYVTISGDEATLSGINQIALDPIDLSQVIGSCTAEMPILIPNDTVNLSGEETATVTVELKSLTTKVFRVTNIELALPEEGLPEGYQAACVTSSLQVYVRAPDDIIEQIYANNIRAVADLTGYTAPGQYTIPVEVFIDGYTDAGVLNDYDVVVRIQEQGEVEAEAEAPAASGQEEEAVSSEALVEHIAEAQQAGVESGSKEAP